MTYRFYPDSVRPAPYGGPEPLFRPINPGDPRLDYLKTYYAATFANLGILRLKAGDRAGAIARLRVATALDPSRVEITNRLRALESSP
jgi:hypothetical protein